MIIKARDIHSQCRPMLKLSRLKTGTRVIKLGADVKGNFRILSDFTWKRTRVSINQHLVSSSTRHTQTENHH